MKKVAKDTKERITGRYYAIGEKEMLHKLANDCGVKLQVRNIDSYSQIGLEGWWDLEKGLHQKLHVMNPIRGNFTIELLKKYGISRSHKIVEIGCGGGILSEYIARQGFNVIGIDISEGAIEVAKQHALLDHIEIEYQTGSVYQLTFPNNSFDVVFSSDFLEHIEDLDKAISEMSRILKPGGIFVFDTIARNEKAVKHYMSLETIGVIPAGTHDPLLFLNPEELEIVASKYDIEFAKDSDNPYGFVIKAIVNIDENFQMVEILDKNSFGTYIGYGIKRHN
ncbi:MAG: bifunctional 2-polyprenyl-6-hydroxyphenol methylase/3-demethylubiquinol 3-O-methyltransferase UbiG [Rhizonema sp. PD37]|nr:bifunctional 2-polyprenyl-6-hydroxyphenol methylase/3-demethylubiquinol 3-O-methyltransferase UbiG [Rhizonema sp. PD37]